jgi:hypothetical protein
MTAPDARQRCRGSCLSAAGCAGPLNTALGTSLGTPILDREVAVLVVPPEFARPVCLGVPTYGDNDAFEQNAGDTDPRLHRFRIVRGLRWKAPMPVF